MMLIIYLVISICAYCEIQLDYLENATYPAEFSSESNFKTYQETVKSFVNLPPYEMMQINDVLT